MMLLLLLLLIPEGSDCYCWAAGKNPGFSGPPRITQVDIGRVRVSWRGLVTRLECADNFVVKYWQRLDPNKYEITPLVPVDKFSIEIDVVPKVVYQFQAVAREEKGVVGGVDWNKSPPASFQTTNRGGVVYAQPVVVDEELRLRGGNYKHSNQVGPEAELQDLVTGQVAGLSLEVFVGILVMALAVIMIIIGIIYRVISKKNLKELGNDELEKSNPDEDDGEEPAAPPAEVDATEEEKESLAPEKNDPPVIIVSSDPT